jgi:hypothetical protein
MYRMPLSILILVTNVWNEVYVGMITTSHVKTEMEAAPETSFKLNIYQAIKNVKHTCSVRGSLMLQYETEFQNNKTEFRI